MDFRTRFIQKKIWINEKEEKVIKQKMEMSGLPTFQEFALQNLLYGKIVKTDFSELHQMNFELSKIGNNVNQLAKIANQYNDVDSQDIVELKQSINDLKLKIESEINKKGN